MGCPSTRRLPLVELADAIHTIEGGHLVTLRQRRVVEDCLYEVIKLTAERHDGLAYVEELAGAFADDMHAEDRVCLAVEDELEATGRIAADLAASDFAIVGDADFVR